MYFSNDMETICGTGIWISEVKYITAEAAQCGCPVCAGKVSQKKLEKYRENPALPPREK